MTRAKRITSSLLDHIIMTCICVPILWYADENKLLPFAYIVSFLLYANKDFFNGRSMAKRMCGIHIITLPNHTIATRMQCFTRNLTILIWPIEILMLLKNPYRRIGDYLAKTECAEKIAV